MTTFRSDAAPKLLPELAQMIAFVELRGTLWSGFITWRLR